MRVLLIAAAALMLAGCVSEKQKEADAQAMANAAAYQRALQNTEDANKCVGYGAVQGTPEYTQCRLQFTQMHQQAALAAAQAQQQQRAMILGAYLGGTGPFQKPNPGVNCTTSYIGTQAYTHCQ